MRINDWSNVSAKSCSGADDEQLNQKLFRISHPNFDAAHPIARLIADKCGYKASDLEAFIAGYSELCRIDLNGKVALEICSGSGGLAGQISQAFPDAKVTALDLYMPEKALGGDGVNWPNLEFRAGSAFDLSFLQSDSVDLVWGQAALHHLAYSPESLCDEVLRILKPGGRLIFIFEPLGHNLLVAAIRAMHVSLREYPDESNLFISQIRGIAGRFSATEVHAFNFFAYPLKSFSNRVSFVTNIARKLDSVLFNCFPRMLRYCANCNIVFTK